MKEVRLLKSHFILIAILILFIITSTMSVWKYLAIHSSLLDLGLYVNQFENNVLTSNIKIMPPEGHLQIFSHLYSFFYNLLPDNLSIIFILATQSFLLIIPAYWVWKLEGWIPASAYLLYFPLWFNILFDFHFEHLAVVFLVGFFLSVRLKRLGVAIIFAVALALVKEIYSLQSIFCGVYILLVDWNKGHEESKVSLNSYKRVTVYFSGIGLIIFGFLYFYIVLESIIPLHSFQAAILDSPAYSWLGTNITDMFWYIVTHTIDIFLEIFSNSDKVFYLILLFGALGFIPLLSPKPLIIAFPILAISLLSNNPNHYGLGYHYTAGLIAPMIFAFADGLPRAKIIWQKIGLYTEWFIPVLLAGLILLHIVLSPSPISRLFWTNKVWSYGYQAYIETNRDIMIKMAIENNIPEDSDIVVSIQNTVNWSPLVQRQHFLIFPEGIAEVQQIPYFGNNFWPPEVKLKEVMAEYVVLDMKRPWFIGDIGCNWNFGKCTNEEMKNEYLNWVETTRNIMQVAFEKDGFIIFRRIKLEQEYES